MHRRVPGGYGALVARADIFLSPHQAEGFGIPLVEAMRLEDPALRATIAEASQPHVAEVYSLESYGRAVAAALGSITRSGAS